MVVRLKAYKEDEVMAQHRTIWGLEDEVICATGESMLTHRSRRTWQELLKILPGTFLEWTRRCWVATTITAGFPEKKVTCISQGKFPICDSEVGKRRARLTGTQKKEEKKHWHDVFMLQYIGRKCLHYGILAQLWCTSTLSFLHKW